MGYKILHNGESFSVQYQNRDYFVRYDQNNYQIVPTINLGNYVLKSLFNGYTGATISLINDKVDTSLFTGYTATTDTRISDIEDIISSLNNDDSYFTGQAYATWSGTGLIFDVVYPAYYIGGIRYDGNSVQITLDTADSTYDRIDVIAVDATGAIKITGDATNDPVQPTVDTTLQLEITSINIAAGATTPTDITDVNIYKENLEWVGNTNIASLVFNSTSTPLNGTKCINSGSFTNLKYFKLVNSGTLNITDYSVLKYYVNLKAAFASTAYFAVKFYNGATLVSTVVTVSNSKFNFNRSTVGSYQLITIPLSSFAFSSSTFDTVYFEMRGTNSSGFRVDDIVLQTGAVTTSPLQNTITTIATANGNASATVASDTITFNKGTGIAISASAKQVTFSFTGSTGGVSTSLFNAYTGTTAPATYLSKSAFSFYSGTTAIASFASKSLFNSYTGTTNTAISNRLLITSFNSYTGTTNGRLTNLETNFITGATNLGNTTNGLYTSVSGHKTQFKSLVGGTNILLTPSATGITISSTGGGTITGATNGLSVTGYNVKLGGTLTGTTSILGGSQILNLGTTGSTLSAFNVNSSSISIGATSIAGSSGFAIGATAVATGSTSFAFGWIVTASNFGAVALGTNNIASGLYSTTFGRGATASGDGSIAGGRGYVTAPSSNSRVIISSGVASINLSNNNISQTSGHGALADGSAIIGGLNHNVPSNSSRSVVLGGNTIKVSSSVLDTVHMPKVRIGLGTSGSLTNDNSNYNFISRNSSTGELETNTGFKTLFNVYTGTTAPASFASKTFFNTFTGTTAPATYVLKSIFSVYTGTTAPATYASKSIFAGYTGATATRLTNIETNFVTGATNIGNTTNGLYTSVSGHKTQFKSLVAGANITITPSSTGVTISTGGGVGEANTASNVGTGIGIYKTKSSVDLQFRSISGGTNIVIASGDTITISSTGGVTFANVLSISYLS